MKAVCIKQYTGDIKEYGIDCIVGKTYGMEYVNSSEIYVDTESGSSVMLNGKEFDECFEFSKA